MKKLMAIVLVVAVLAMGSGIALAAKNPDAIDKSNGLPSGPHYNLNIIGVKYEKNMTPLQCGEGHRIFVLLGDAQTKKTTDIYLYEATPAEVAAGEGFKVLDCDGTDRRAEFRLPDPSMTGNCTAYSVYIRALGKPNGKAKMTTCAETCTEIDPGTGDCVTWVEVCSNEPITLERTKGKKKFVNVSKELLTICALVCTDWDPVTGACIKWEWKRVYLFDPLLQDYLWRYDNNGLKLAQLRFYPQQTCYDPADWACGP